LGYLVTDRGLDADEFLTSVESGPEVRAGSGQLDTGAYYCTVE
jgi:hypothetical protein